ncbi:MAG: type II toxin-antitoxin system RelE/ParE family toxin, partial [Bryobacterales bacterium]|nr:type II toxin-antitoxin system RelE/ParE family toxin [Bryobacterales bacterium]
MSLYSLTRQARQDIIEIWTYIAEDNPEAADRVEQAIFDACEFVAASPGRGHINARLTDRALRFWTLPKFSNYIVVYDPESSP